MHVKVSRLDTEKFTRQSEDCCNNSQAGMKGMYAKSTLPWKKKSKTQGWPVVFGSHNRISQITGVPIRRFLFPRRKRCGVISVRNPRGNWRLWSWHLYHCTSLTLQPVLTVSVAASNYNCVCASHRGLVGSKTHYHQMLSKWVELPTKKNAGKRPWCSQLHKERFAMKLLKHHCRTGCEGMWRHAQQEYYSPNSRGIF